MSFHLDEYYEVELDKLLSNTWELLIFKVNPHAKGNFIKLHGAYGAGFVDSSGDISQYSEDFEYGPNPQIAIEKAIERWKKEEEI